MKFIKILSLLFLGIFLMSNVTALMSVISDFQDGSITATITDGQSIRFNADFGTIDKPMSISVKLYNSNDDLIYTFAEQSVNDYTFSATYSITKSIYANPGTYHITLIGIDKKGYSTGDSLTLTVTSQTPLPPADTTPPVITILGSNPITITQGTLYSDAGAVATDNTDGDISSGIQVTNNVNVNAIGTYTVVYRVSDSAGNQATATRIVYVVSSADVTAPVITILSPVDNRGYDTDTITIRVSTNEDADVRFRLDEGASRDMSETGINIFTYTLNDLYDGEHFLTFYATDSSGNTGRADVSFYVETEEEHHVSKSVRITGDSSYEQNKYYDQFSGGVIYTDIPVSQKSAFNVTTLLYIILGVVGLGIIATFVILFVKIRK